MLSNLNNQISQHVPMSIAMALFAIYSISEGACFETALKIAKSNLTQHRGDIPTEARSVLQKSHAIFAETHYTFDGMEELMLACVSDVKKAISMINDLSEKFTSDMIDEDYAYWNHHENPKFLIEEKHTILAIARSESAKLATKTVRDLPKTMSKIDEALAKEFGDVDDYWINNLVDYVQTRLDCQ